MGTQEGGYIHVGRQVCRWVGREVGKWKVGRDSLVYRQERIRMGG